MAKKALQSISAEEACRAIYIDFEGTMKDPASLLGILVRGDDGELDFRQAVFERGLWDAVHRAKPKQRTGCNPHTADFFDTMCDLRERAEAESRLVFAYSTREVNEITNRILLERQSNWWETNLINMLPYASAWKKRHHHDVEFKNKAMSGKYTLDQFLKLIGYEAPVLLGPGNSAQRIKYVREMLNRRGGNFGALTPTAKGKWTKALRHNWHDCEGMRELMIRCAQDLP